MAVRDVVWICDKHYHTFNYLMGRFLEVHTGKHSATGSTTIESNREQIKRSIVSLVTLRIHRDDLFLGTKTGTKMLWPQIEKYEITNLSVFNENFGHF